MTMGHWLGLAVLLIGAYYIGRNHPLGLPVVG